VKNNTVHTVLDAPIVIVRAAAQFIINLFIYLLFCWYRLQIKWDHKKNLIFVVVSADGRKSTTRCNSKVSLNEYLCFVWGHEDCTTVYGLQSDLSSQCLV
jgi:hypothetical protein